MRRLAGQARPYFPSLVLGIAILIIIGPLTAVPAAILGVIQNRVIVPAVNLKPPDMQALYLSLGGVFLSLVLTSFATYAGTYTVTSAGQRLLSTLRQGLFDRLLRMPLQVFDEWRPGELIARFNSDLQVMSDAVSVAFPQLVQAVSTFVFSLAAMIYINWLLTLVLLVLAPLISIAVSRFSKLISSNMLRTQSRIADLTATLSEVLQAHRVVKAFGREDFENRRFRNRNDDYYGSFMKLTQFVQLQPAVITTITGAAVVAIIWLSVQQVIVHRLNSGTLLTYWLLVVNLINPMNRVASFVSDLTKAIVAAGRTYEVIDLPSEHEAPSSAPTLAIKGEIAFEDVTFWYKRDEAAALANVNATIHPGEIVALVGPSGAGKTTFVNMIPRFYAPQQGRICVDAIDIAGVSLTELRKQIAIVPQDPQLFRASIAENIRYGRLEATDDEVRSAAMEANADEFVASLPDGYATEVGERGVRLSGGQRQRIAIARAIVRDPRILILDEATSALDSHSEALIEQALDRLLPGRTTLIIAHRLSTIRRANRILYIDGGRVLEFGTHDELIAKNGRYARLHAAQFAT